VGRKLRETKEIIGGFTIATDWDDEKADANVAKHGVTFKLAATVFYDPLALSMITRRIYNEHR
jgi:uncharacterized DUF497 family protein